MAMTRTRRLLGRFHLAFTAVLGLGIWLGAILLASRPALRGIVDWSPRAMFTLGEPTVDLLERVRERGETLEIDLFWQPPQPGRTDAERHYVGIANRVHSLARDLFETMELRGGDAVEFREHNLLSEDSIQATRERAEELGVRANNTVVLRLGKVARKLDLYRDMARIEQPNRAPVPGAAQQQALPVLESFDGEEAVTSTLLSMVEHGKPRAYFVVGLGKAQDQLVANTAGGYSELLGALQDDGFEAGFLQIDRNSEIPDDADLVVLIEPTRELPAEAEDAVWRYLRRGGRVLIDFMYTDLPEDWNPRFESLLGRLGLRIGDALVCTGIRTREGYVMGGRETQNVPLVVDPNHPITKPLAEAQRTPRFATARALFPAASSEDGVTTDLGLLRTQPWSWLAQRTANGPDQRPPSPDRMSSYSVGAVVEVEATEASGDGPLARRDGIAVVYSGLGFLNLIFRDNSNGDLALNTFNWLTERRERVTIRADRYVSKKLVVTGVQLAHMKSLLVYWIPGVLLAAGVVVFVWRNRN
jgi:hypothetical protein